MRHVCLPLLYEFYIQKFNRFVFKRNASLLIITVKTFEILDKDIHIQASAISRNTTALNFYGTTGFPVFILVI